MSLKTNYEEVLASLQEASLRAGRKPQEIQLMAVSKTHPFSDMLAIHEFGQNLFGENRVQEVQQKVPQPRIDAMDLHLIGHLQSNKAKKAIQLFNGIDSVDSLKLAEKLEQNLERPFPILLELKTAKEETKSGFENEKELFEAVEAILGWKYLKIKGLMTIGPLEGDEREVRGAFSSLRGVLERMNTTFSIPDCNTLSMGMSTDYAWAIEEGSTVVRIGTKLFGKRG